MGQKGVCGKLNGRTGIVLVVCDEERCQGQFTLRVYDKDEGGADGEYRVSGLQEINRRRRQKQKPRLGPRRKDNNR